MSWLVREVRRFIKWMAILFLGMLALVIATTFLATPNRNTDRRPQVATPATVAPAKQEAVKPQPKPSTDTPENRQKLVDALAANFNPVPAGWAGFEVRKVEMKNIGQVTATLNYSTKPSGYAQVQSDTKEVVRFCLKWIQDQGHDPAKEWITVTAWAHLPETGETGKSLVRIMGRSVYDFNKDQIEFTKDANLW
jgi:hypothetical protein